MTCDEKHNGLNDHSESPDTLQAPGGSSTTAERLVARPVEIQERVRSLDLLRGVALLGILPINILGFAWPDEIGSAPLLDPGAGSLDLALWAFDHFVFDTKMISLFSMLFGAGLVLMSDRAEERKTRLLWIHYRRMVWLLVIGLIHAYLIWSGDILVPYAACGFLLYPFRKLRPRTLILVGALLNLMYVPVFLGFRTQVLPLLQETAMRAEAKLEADVPLRKWERVALDAWKTLSGSDSRQAALDDIDEHRSSHSKIVKLRAQELIGIHLLGIPFFMIEWFGGRMLIGMGLMKLGVFSAKCSTRSYLAMMLVGYGVGLPFMMIDTCERIQHDFFINRGFLTFLEGWDFLWFMGSLPVVFGHIGAVMLFYQSGAIAWLTRRLAAVGRMALSNYLLDSIAFTTIFESYGLGLYGTVHRPMLYAFVLVMWTFKLWFSPLWLGAFLYGPAEWLWRSLTYWKLLPMRLKLS